MLPETVSFIIVKNLILSFGNRYHLLTTEHFILVLGKNNTVKRL